MHDGIDVLYTLGPKLVSQSSKTFLVTDKKHAGTVVASQEDYCPFANCSVVVKCMDVDASMDPSL